MGAALKLALKYGMKYYRQIMQFIGEGWTINQIEKWLKKH